MTRPLPWLALAGLHLLGGCGAEPSTAPATGVWRRDHVQQIDPAAPWPRASHGDVSRPLWDPAQPALVDLPPQHADAWLEWELAPGTELGQQLQFDHGGQRVALVVEPTAQPDPPGSWRRYRASLADVPAGRSALSLRSSNGTPLPAVSQPRLYARRDDPRPNLLWIVLDTVRADMLSCYGHDRPTSPHLDAFAAAHVQFERAISQASWTLPSLSTMLTALHAGSHGVVHIDQRLGPQYLSVIEVLSAAGYTTAGIVSGTFTDAYWGFDQGFDQYDDLGMVLDEADEEHLPDLPTMREKAHRRVTSPLVTNKAVAWLRRHQDRRFALLVHYFDPHQDYLWHRGVSKQFSPRPSTEHFPGDPDPAFTARVRANYEGEIALTDKHIGRLLERLAELELLASTVVVITADHGEEFYDHARLGHGNTLFNELVHVPLLLAAPGLRSQRVAAPVGLIDLAPTILELCGLPEPASWQGRSLLPLLDGQESPSRPVFSSHFHPERPGPQQAGARLVYRVDAEGFALIHDSREGAPELYAWADDRGQHRDLAPQQDDRVAELRALHEADQVHRAPIPGVDGVEITPELRATLEALGYDHSDQ